MDILKDDNGKNYIIDFNILSSAPHCLICGSTGSGKSQLLKYFIFDLIKKNYFIHVIDIKKIDFYFLREYKNILDYSDEIPLIIERLYTFKKTILKRYEIMRSLNIKPEPHYIIIDEIADLILNNKLCGKLIAEIATIGRGANWHLLIATQRPTREVLTPLIKSNVELRIALKTTTKQESKNIIEVNGAEQLKRHKECIIKNGLVCGVALVPNLTDEVINEKLKELEPFKHNQKTKSLFLLNENQNKKHLKKLIKLKIIKKSWL